MNLQLTWKKTEGFGQNKEVMTIKIKAKELGGYLENKNRNRWPIKARIGVYTKKSNILPSDTLLTPKLQTIGAGFKKIL